MTKRKKKSQPEPEPVPIPRAKVAFGSDGGLIVHRNGQVHVYRTNKYDTFICEAPPARELPPEFLRKVERVPTIWEHETVYRVPSVGIGARVDPALQRLPSQQFQRLFKEHVLRVADRPPERKPFVRADPHPYDFQLVLTLINLQQVQQLLGRVRS